MNRRMLVAVVVVTVLSMVLAGCATPEPEEVEVTREVEVEVTSPPEEVEVVVTATPEPGAEPIKIGLPAILTGADTYVHGEMIIDAAKLAAEEINADGGVLGRPIEIVVKDDAGDPKEGVNVAHSFCDDPEIVAVHGHAYSGVSIPTLPVYNECGMPIIVHGTNPRITEFGFRNVVQNTPNDTITGAAGADYAKDELGVESVAVIHNKTMWGKAVAEVFNHQCEQIGLEVTSFQGVDAESMDFTPTLTKVGSEDPDAVYFAGYTENALMRKQMIDLGMDQLYIAAEATSSEYIDTTQQAGVGTLSATAAPPLDFRPEIRDFARNFEEMFGKPPESWSPYYYDAIYAIADAIERGGSAERSAIIEALYDVDISSVVYPGGLQFDSHGRVENPVTFVWELKVTMEWEVVYVWEGTPPYEEMSEDEYRTFLENIGLLQ